MRFFFALNLTGKPLLDEGYLNRYRKELITRNMVALVLYGLAYTNLRAAFPNLAGLLVLLASCHAVMLGVVLGRSSDED